MVMISPPELASLGISYCEFCKDGDHRRCPGAVESIRVEKIRDETGKVKRTKRTPYMLRCYCCGNHPRCRVCGTDRDSEVDQNWWRCLPEYQQQCAGRVRDRLRANPIWRMLQECRVAGANARRRAKLDQARIEQGLIHAHEKDSWEDVMALSDQELAQRTEQMDWTTWSANKNDRLKIKTKMGKCECCGEPTKGGRFLPGHDAKLKKILRTRWQSGDESAREELIRRKWLKESVK